MARPEKCRICGQKLTSDAAKEGLWYPFCSQRCRLLDLGKWFDQQYNLPRQESSNAPGQPEPGRLGPDEPENI